MAVDLSLLWQRAVEHAPTDRAAAERAFWDNVRMWARRGDLLSYGLYVHGEQSEELRALCYSRHGLLMAGDLEASPLSIHVLPPEHAKTAFARWEAEMRLGIDTTFAYENPKVRVPSGHYIMNTASQAEKQIMEIEGTIEHNRRYHELFPLVKADKRLGWTKDHFFLQRPRSRPDPSLQGCGMFGPIQGSRATFQFVDDPTDQQDARSEKLMTEQAAWLVGTAADRVLKGGLRRYRMTRWSEKDPYSRLSAIRGMLVRVMPALGYWDGLGEEGGALWEEVWPVERLLAKKQELIDTGSAYLWHLTYMCNPRQAEGDMFRREFMVYGLPPWGDEAVKMVEGKAEAVA